MMDDLMTTDPGFAGRTGSEASGPARITLLSESRRRVGSVGRMRDGGGALWSGDALSGSHERHNSSQPDSLSRSNLSQNQADMVSSSHLQHFIENAPLTEQQKVAVAVLSGAVAERPFPLNLSHELVHGRDMTSTHSSKDEDLADASAMEMVLINAHQFYKWFADLEDTMKSETEQKYQHYVGTLMERIQTCDSILSQVDEILNLLGELELQHQAVATKTKTLHDACDRLLVEKQRLVKFADVLRSKLNYFDELENVSKDFYAPNMSVSGGSFLPLLKRLDECILYIESNPQYAESGVYLVKFRQLQSRALAMIRSHVSLVLKSASVQVQTALRGSDINKQTVFGGVEASVLYAKFKAIAGEMKPVLEEINSRCLRKDYAQMLSDCQRSYCDQRLLLIKRVVQQRISNFSKKETLPSLTRLGFAYLMEVCQLEHQLFCHFFTSSSVNNSCLAPLLDPLCSCLYDTLCPKLIHEASLDVLCELVGILKDEVLGEQLSRKSESLPGLHSTILKILKDVIERLIFRARTYVRDEIRNFFPVDEDLDYPAKLEEAVEVISKRADGETDDVSKTWYPPLGKTLFCLSKLYRCLEPPVFTGLAQEAVEICSLTIQKGSKLIAKRSSTMDGQLFLIKHLLILREQIAPFDIEFSTTQKELDFSHLLEHLRRILRGQVLFDWSRPSALARTLSPRVLENQIDAKKELEKCLKSTCEEFIMSVTKVVVDPMLSFVTKVSAFKSRLASSSHDSEGKSLLLKSLKDQAFATPDKVAELIQKVSISIQQELPRMMAKMKLYLQNPSTRAILFKPIKTNIIEAHLQIISLIKSEYSTEEMTDISITPVQELQARLDSLLL